MSAVDTGSVRSVRETPLARARRVPAWAMVFGTVFACAWGGNQFSPLLLMYENRDHYSAVLVNAFLGVYVLGLAPALLIAGSLSDRHGRKPLMLAALSATVVGSLLLSLGGVGPEFLLIGRLFSGLAVGIAMAVGTSWIKELSQPPYDRHADRAAGARRGSLSFTLGSAIGALVAGLIAQWGPIPQVLPFAVHILIALPFFAVVLRIPETQTNGGLTGPWYRQLRIPSASHKRFVRVVAVSAPWTFVGAAIGYGYLPTQLRSATGAWGLVFATAATVIALGVSSAFQPVARRIHSAGSARGLTTMILLIALGVAVVTVSIQLQSIWLGLLANAIIGVGLGIGLFSGLQEVQAIAGSRDLAGLTGVFYALSYVGFLAPAVIAAVAGFVPLTVILTVVVALALLSYLLVLVSSRKHLPAA